MNDVIVITFFSCVVLVWLGFALDDWRAKIRKRRSDQMMERCLRKLEECQPRQWATRVQEGREDDMERARRQR